MLYVRNITTDKVSKYGQTRVYKVEEHLLYYQRTIILRL